MIKALGLREDLKKTDPRFVSGVEHFVGGPAGFLLE